VPPNVRPRRVSTPFFAVTAHWARCRWWSAHSKHGGTIHRQRGTRIGKLEPAPAAQQARCDTPRRVHAGGHSVDPVVPRRGGLAVVRAWRSAGGPVGGGAARRQMGGRRCARAVAPSESPRAQWNRHVVRRFEDDEVQIVRGMPVTTPARTALDLACRLPIDDAVVAIDALTRATKLKMADVDVLAQRYRGRRVIRRARVALDLVDPGAESRRRPGCGCSTSGRGSHDRRLRFPSTTNTASWLRSSTWVGGTSWWAPTTRANIIG
jgi:hypothetical protein